MNARKKLLERRGTLLSMKQEELVDLVLSLERSKDIQLKSAILYKERISFWQTAHHRMAKLGIVPEVFYEKKGSKRIASR